MSGAYPAFRPRGVDGSTWSRTRRAWIASTEARGRTRELRAELAASIGLSADTLGDWARRCGWPGIQRHNGRGA